MAGEGLARAVALPLDRIAKAPGLVRPVAVGVACAAAVALVAVVDPNQPGHYPTCPLKAFTGLSCPGCGTLRAVHALAHGDLAGAVGHNVLTVLALPFLLWAYVAWVRRVAARRPRTWVPPAWLLRGLLVVLLTFTVVRNLPGVTVLGR